MTETIKIKEDSGRVVTVGELCGQCFYKRVKRSKHLHIKSNSWGIDAEVFKIIEVECIKIKILDEETDTLYETTPTVFRLMGKYLHHKPHRAQIFLKINKFTKTENYVSAKQKVQI